MELGLAAASADGASVAIDDDPAGAYPLALIEAALRGHGLGAYVRDVAPA
jgi:lysine-N-methylase